MPRDLSFPMLTDDELDDLRAWWRYAFKLHAHLAARPDDTEARLMLSTFVRWLLVQPEWVRLGCATAN